VAPSVEEQIITIVAKLQDVVILDVVIDSKLMGADVKLEVFEEQTKP
jgi:hypothetical protein